MSVLRVSNLFCVDTQGCTLFDKVVMIALILMPILQIYALLGINLSSLVVGSLIVYGFIFKKYKVANKVMPQSLWRYFIYFIGITIFSGIYNLVEMPNRVAGVLFMVAQYVMFFACAEKHFFYQAYRFLSIIAIVFFFFQELSFAAVGVRIPGIIPFLPLDPTYAAMDAFGSFAEYLAIVNRSTAFFSEPAHFAQFLLPFLAMSLYWEKGILRWIFAGSTCVALFLLESGNGIVGLCCILSVYFLHLLKQGSGFAKFAIIVLALFAVIYLPNVLGENESSQYYSERSSEITMSSSSGDVHSGFYRIYRGFYVYAEYNPIEMLFGINNFSEIESKIRQSSVSYLFPKGDMYFNVVQAFLIKTGIIGLIFFIFMMIELWRGNNVCGKSIIFTFFIFSFMSALHMSSIMAVYFILAYFFIKEKKLVTQKYPGYVQQNNSYTGGLDSGLSTNDGADS